MVYFTYKTSPRTSAAPIPMRKKVVTLRSRRRENGGRGETRARNFRQFDLIKPFQGCPDRVSSNVIFLCVSREKISFNSLYAPRKKQQWEGKTSELFKENLAEPGRGPLIKISPIPLSGSRVNYVLPFRAGYADSTTFYSFALYENTIVSVICISINVFFIHVFSDE